MMIHKLFIAICIMVFVTRAEMIHHVVGDDRGWEPDSDIASWSSNRVFHVGDKIWFTYSAALENVVELKSKDEYEACDVRNPIKIFMDGLDVLSLEEEGIRYFVSGKSESCKNGLKLHVDVQSQSHPNNQNNATSMESAVVAADAPTVPSDSTQLNELPFALLIALLVSYTVV